MVGSRAIENIKNKTQRKIIGIKCKKIIWNIRIDKKKKKTFKINVSGVLEGERRQIFWKKISPKLKWWNASMPRFMKPYRL